MVISTRSKNKQASAVAKKSTAAASSKGKENAKPRKQTARSNGVKARKKKKDADAGTSSKEKAVEEEEKSSRISNAIMKKIDAWWQENSDVLIKFALEERNWDDDNDAKDTIVAYKQFLIVKREMKDWDNELLPCDCVIEMIQQHQQNESLDFENDLKHLCGHDFGGADILLDRQEDNFNRQNVTLKAVKQRFGAEFNEELWNFRLFKMIEIDDEDELEPSVALCRRNMSDPLETLLGEFPFSCENEYENMQFVLEHNQEKIDPKEDTILSLGLTAFNTVIALHVDYLWLQVEIKVEGSDTPNKSFVYVTQKKLPIVKDKLACACVEYVYFFNGKRLYGFETPLSLQMKHFDVIEAVPAEDFKYPTCNCCNKTDCEVEG